jgi:CBS domain-containing protein
MVEERLRVAPVVENEKTMKLLGILSRRSLLLLSSSRSTVRVKDLAEEPPLAFTPDAGIEEAAKKMLSVDTWYAPVVDAGRLLGLLGLENIIDYIVSEKPNALQAPVETSMSPTPVYVEPDDPIRKAWQVMLSRGLAALPVVEKGRLVGVVAEYDLLARGYARPVLESPEGPRRGPRVREVMSTPPVAVEPGDPLLRAAEEMLRRDIGRVYVVEGGRLVGVVDRSDVVRAWLRREPS